MEREDCGVCRCLKIPGMCFDPSDEELVTHYLKEKVEGRPLRCNHLMTELQIYHDDMMPWEVIKDDNPYWITSSSDSSNKNKIKKIIYVFTELRKRVTRMIRRSGCGSWTGQNNPVVKNKAGDDIGYNKLLTFYKDSDDKKKRKKKITDDDDQEHGHWMMHEYSLFGIDNYVLCKIIKEVKISEKASVLCPTKAAKTQDFRTQASEHIRNVASGEGDQILDESTADWDMNGWMEELYQEFSMNISDVQDLPVLSQPIIFDGQEDNNMIHNNHIPDFLVEEEAIAVVNQPSDCSVVADLDANGLNSILHERDGTTYGQIQTGTSAGVGVARESGVMENYQQGQVIQEISMQEIPVAVWGKNGETDGSYKGLYGACNHDIIIIDDDSTGVHDSQELMMIEAADAPQIQEINVDNQADDFWNGLDVVLDFSSPDLFDLWPGEFDEQSCSIFEDQPGKRMRYGEEDCEERPSGKKQRCL